MRSLSPGIMLTAGAALLVAASVGGLAGAWLASARPTEAQSTTITATEYRIVDRQGVLRGVVGMTPDGSVSFLAGDRTGVPHAQFGVGSDGSAFMSFTDSQDRARLVARMLPNGTPSLTMLDANGQVLPLGTAGTGSGGGQVTGASVPPPPAVSNGATPGDCTVAERARDPTERALLDAINSFRTSAGLPTVTVHPDLLRAAQWKATALRAVGPRDLTVADHDDSFRTWEQRVIDCGFPAESPFSEELGSSVGADSNPLAGWLASPVHREILVDPRWTLIGLARVNAGSVDGVPVLHWVMVLGG